MSFLLYLSIPISTIIVAIVCSALSLLGLKIIRKKIGRERLVENHEVASFIFNAVGLIYAVLLAFVVFATWSDFDNSKKNVEKEASKLQIIFLDAQTFPDPVKKNIQNLVMYYSAKVCDEEWKTMENGEFSTTTRDSFLKLWEEFGKIDVKSLSNPVAYEESFKSLNELGEYRRLRVFDVNNTIPALIWVIVIIGAVISVAYTYFFGSKSIKAQYIMTASLATTISLVLLLIFILDHPFTGYNKITPDAFRNVIDLFNHILSRL